MSYTPTDNYSATTTQSVSVGAVLLPVTHVTGFSGVSSVSPAWVTVKSTAGSETVKVIGLSGLNLNIQALTLSHTAGACVVGFNIPKDLICEIVKSCTGLDCLPAQVV